MGDRVGIEEECERHTGRAAWACPHCWAERRPWPHEEKRLRIIAAARETVGWPFYHAGRSSSGIDCVGVVQHAADAAGFRHDHFTGYHVGTHGQAAIDLMAGRLDVIQREEALPGDVVLIAIRRQPCHFGILTDTGTMIHARFRAAVTEHIFDARWIRRAGEVFRFREIAHG